MVAVLFVCLAAAAYLLYQAADSDRLSQWALKVPVVIFATWCGLANLVNLCQWFVSTGATVSHALAAGLICIAMLVGVAVIYFSREKMIAVVMVWAGIGIVMAQPSLNTTLFATVLTSVLTIGVAAMDQSPDAPPLRVMHPNAF